ncbi:MAG: site-2 protease family protein [Campylobacterales bacterium]|nr:site-2 protease family protein [Campylobacterales bacterium]
MENREIIEIITKILALLIGIVGHEIMHGYSAYRYGDNTAKIEGRLSINPIKHVDIMGTIVVPLLLFISNAPFLFGWAKPVPINMQTVVNNGGLNGAIMVSLAGIIYNISVAAIASVLLGFGDFNSEIGLFFGYLLAYLIVYNIILGIFNLWPIPPLDGSQALAYFFMKFGNYKVAEMFDKVGNYGMIILVLILATPLNQIFFAPALYLINLLIK